jgi:putative chitobiose transport system substrate-binding protein
MEIPVPQHILEKVNRDLQDILFNDKDVQEGLDKIVEEVNKQLKD